MALTDLNDERVVQSADEHAEKVAAESTKRRVEISATQIAHDRMHVRGYHRQHEDQHQQVDVRSENDRHPVMPSLLISTAVKDDREQHRRRNET